jgi:RuvB-like protein 1 (pontin 52)
LLDRLLIIRTAPYSVEEMSQILSIRARAEGIVVAEDALLLLSQLGERATLRFSVQLLTPAKIVAATNGRVQIERADVEEIDSLFFDAKRSAQLLADQADKFIT